MDVFGDGKRERMRPIKAAEQILTEKFPSCDAAILAGSVVRGEATSTSDLDIVIFDGRLNASYRESFDTEGWPVEVFVHNWSSYRKFLESDCSRGQPSMPRMITEGKVLKWEDRLTNVQNEAALCLEKGPPAWSKEAVEMKRYFLTDALDDFIGCHDRGEALFIAATLAKETSDFYLRVNQQWSGSSKWMARALRNYDAAFSARLIRCFDHFYRENEKTGVVQLVEDVLHPYGGRLFDGFSMDKPKGR